ncbi:hypothetical protein HY989_05975 [Candidatus Micrarchaeota archaeon]|nr:hypothetical protein [Candidatus Micrarchaeota archaeon]
MIALLSLMDGLNIVVVILTFFSLFKMMTIGFIENKLIALVVTIAITYLVLLPVTWFTYMIFAVVFMLEFPTVVMEGLFNN